MVKDHSRELSWLRSFLGLWIVPAHHLLCLLFLSWRHWSSHLVVWSVLNVLKNILSYLVAACFSFICRISHPAFLSWIMSSYYMVCLLSLSWRPRSPHLVVWSVVWEEEANVAASHCVSAEHCTSHCVSARQLHHQNDAALLQLGNHAAPLCGPRVRCCITLYLLPLQRCSLVS